MQIEQVPVDKLIPYANNARTHTDAQVTQIASSIREFGFNNPVLIDEHDGLIAGHGRLLAAKKLGLAQVPAIRLQHLSEQQRKAFIIADNKIALNSGWDEELLKLELSALDDDGFDMELLGFGADELEDLLEMQEFAGASDGKKLGNLSDRFLIPPFSVLNAREGWWQDRKRAWLALGIKSEEGRGDNGSAAPGGSPMVSAYDKNGERMVGLKNMNAAAKSKGGYGKCLETGIGEAYGRDEMNATSIFDPVLCEIAYRWFSPESGIVLDPFAGGSVRGIVASKLGRQYIGHELRPEQVAANRIQGNDICMDDERPPAWIEGDSRNIDKTCKDVQADFVFSCPPYADLEVYSDDPNDLSTLGYAEFRNAYKEIIAKSCAQLKQNRFACFVVGEVRDKKGNYYNFVGDTIDAFREAGLHFYNEAILVTAVGSLPIRAGKQFAASRKLGKTHQNVLVFVKGDGKEAAKACGEIEISDDCFKSAEEALQAGGEE